MVLAHDISKGDRTRDVKITQNITFETMLLAPDTLKGLKDAGFHKPSPVQLYGIPIGKCGFDLLLEAKSGTGKTAVFAIIALEKLDFSKGLQVVILTPTREIAAQIWDVLKQIGSRYKELQVEVVMGGLPVQNDIEKFKKPVHIVVGSPGRLKQLIQYNHIDTKTVRLLVLDEADKLMDYSFQSDIKFIYTALPQQKQVIMSSATYPEKSRDTINRYVQNASHVCPASDCILLGIDQKVLFVKYNGNVIRHTEDRFKELHKILGRLQFKQCLVFCNYQARVEEVHKLLMKAEWPSQKLHGQQGQVDRLDALKTLQQYKCRILVSTDLAARGIDASNIDLVINFEPPVNWQTYLHRIGRAGRFGSYGLAITILSEGKETTNFKKIFSSLELSLNMRHLWSDQEFSVDNIPSTKSSDLYEPMNSSTNTDFLEKTPESIWELLSCKSNTHDSTNTFKLQCELKEDSGIPKIEPFSELMFSFKDKTCLDNVDDIVFKHMEIHRTHTNKLISVDHQKTDHTKKEGVVNVERIPTNKDYNNCNKNSKKDLQGILCNDNLKSVDPQYTIVEDSVIMKPSEINKENDRYSESNKEFKELLSNDKLISVDSQNTIGEDAVIMKQSDIDKEDNIYDSESDEILNELLSHISMKVKNITTSNNEIYGTNKTLVNLELPTDLISNSKFTVHDTKQQINKTISGNKSYSSQRSGVEDDKEFRLSNKQSELRTKSEIPDKNVEPRKVDSCIENARHYRDRREVMDDETNNVYKKEHRDNYSQQPNYARSHMRKYSLQNYINQKISAKLYSDWYHELKMKMKHIEQAIYIDEMSKL